MKSLQELKKEIVFNNEMYELVDILKKTAVAQFQALSTRHKALIVEKRFSGYLNKMFDLVDYRSVRHPVLTNPVRRVLLVIMTTDMGFLGGVNTNMIETALSRLGRRDEALIVVVGEKGRDYFEGSGRDCAFLPGVGDEVKFEEAMKLRDYIFAACVREKFGRVLVTYPKFFSFARQEIETLQMIPCDYLFRGGSKQPPSLEAKSALGGQIDESKIIEVIEEESQRRQSLPLGGDEENVIYEPFRDKVIDYLLRAWLARQLHNICWHSKLSELAARAMHLDQSLSELTEMKTAIRLQYLKSKHEATDRTIRDIFGGRLVTLRKRLNVNR